MRKKKNLENNRPQEQNRISVCLTVGQGLFDLYLPVRDSMGNIIPEQSGELLLAADEVTFFHVSSYNGKKDLDYMCVQGNHVTLYHNGKTKHSKQFTIPNFIQRTFNGSLQYDGTEISWLPSSALFDDNG